MEILQAIFSSVTTPYTLVGFTLVTFLYFLGYWKNRNVSRIIEAAEKNKTPIDLALIQTVTETVVPKDITAEEWIRKNRQQGIGYIIAGTIVLTAVIIVIWITKQNPPKEQLKEADKQEIKAAAALVAEGFLETYQCMVIVLGKDLINSGGICKENTCGLTDLASIYSHDIKSQIDLLNKSCTIVNSKIKGILDPAKLSSYSLSCKAEDRTEPWYDQYKDYTWDRAREEGVAPQLQIALIQLVLWDKLAIESSEKRAAAKAIMTTWTRDYGSPKFEEARAHWENVRRHCQRCIIGIDGLPDTDTTDWETFLSIVFERFLPHYSYTKMDFFPGCDKYVVQFENGNWIKKTKEKGMVCSPFLGCLAAEPQHMERAVKSTISFAEKLIK